MTTEIDAAQRPSFIRRVWRAFKNFAIVFSFVVNFVLVALLITIALQSDAILSVKSDVAEPLLLDLDQAFAALGDTTIQTTVYITDTVPVVFGLPLNVLLFIALFSWGFSWRSLLQEQSVQWKARRRFV